MIPRDLQKLEIHEGGAARKIVWFLEHISPKYLLDNSMLTYWLIFIQHLQIFITNTYYN